MIKINKSVLKFYHHHQQPSASHFNKKLFPLLINISGYNGDSFVMWAESPWEYSHPLFVYMKPTDHHCSPAVPCMSSQHNHISPILGIPFNTPPDEEERNVIKYKNLNVIIEYLAQRWLFCSKLLRIVQRTYMPSCHRVNIWPANFSAFLQNEVWHGI